MQKLSFVGVGFSWCHPTEHLGQEVRYLGENFSFMPLGVLCILFNCNCGIFYKTFGFFLELCFGIFPYSK